MDELDLRPSAPPWLKGILLAELALLVLIVEVRAIAMAADVPGVGALYLFVRGALIVMPFGAAIGAFAPHLRRRRAIKLVAASFALLVPTGIALLLSLRGLHALERTAEDVAIGSALLVIPVAIAAELYVRWSPEPPANVDLAELLDTFE